MNYNVINSPVQPIYILNFTGLVIQKIHYLIAHFCKDQWALEVMSIKNKIHASNS